MIYLIKMMPYPLVSKILIVSSCPYFLSVLNPTLRCMLCTIVHAGVLVTLASSILDVVNNGGWGARNNYLVVNN